MCVSARLSADTDQVFLGGGYFFLNACVSVSAEFLSLCVMKAPQAEGDGCARALLCGARRGAFSNPSPTTSDEPGIIE